MPIIDSIMESVVTESMLSAAKLKISLTPILIPLITDKKKIADRNLVQRSLDKIKGVKNTHWLYSLDGHRNDPQKTKIYLHAFIVNDTKDIIYKVIIFIDADLKVQAKVEEIYDEKKTTIPKPIVRDLLNVYLDLAEDAFFGLFRFSKNKMSILLNYGLDNTRLDTINQGQVNNMVKFEPRIEKEFLNIVKKYPNMKITYGKQGGIFGMKYDPST